MEARARLFGHPIHQMLIVFPLGLLATAIIFDIVALASNNGYWAELAYWMILAGIIGGVVAAPFGFMDWMKIPGGTRAKHVGILHARGNVAVLLLFIVSWWMRRDDPRAPETLALALAWGGGALSLFTAWLGGELVDRHGIGVAEGANVDAPSSLSGRPARATSDLRVRRQT